MAVNRNSLGTVAILVLAGVLLAVLNPTQADFKTFLAESQGRAAAAGDTGLIGEIGKGVGTAVGGLASGLYKPRSYVLFSTFSSPGDKGSVYLGIAKLFIKLK